MNKLVNSNNNTTDDVTTLKRHGLSKKEIKQLIDKEHGIRFHKNIKLNGYSICRGYSFITFHFTTINNINTVVIDYMHITNKKDFIKLLGFCVNFWTGYKVRFIYYKEHRRDANYVKKYFNENIGFNIKEEFRENTWKKAWQSTNGYHENEILEAYT